MDGQHASRAVVPDAPVTLDRLAVASSSQSSASMNSAPRSVCTLASRAWPTSSSRASVSHLDTGCLRTIRNQVSPTSCNAAIVPASARPFPWTTGMVPAWPLANT